MCRVKIKYVLMVVLFFGADAWTVTKGINMSINSEPKPKNDDYVTLNVGDTLQIDCLATERMRGMRIKHIDFDSYDPESKQLNITWEDSLQWEENTFQHKRIYSYEQNFKYKLFLDIKYVELEHSGWQICYINKYVFRYLYVYVDDRKRTIDNHFERKLIITKSKSNITIPCISPNPNSELDLYYYSYPSYLFKLFSKNLTNKYNDRIGYQLAAVPRFNKFACCYTITPLCIEVIVIRDTNEDENNLMPIFNEDYSIITTLGADLTIECIWINSNNLTISLHWDTPQFIKEINKTHTNDFNIKVMDNTTIHISTLTVKNVTLNDIGFYKCSVIDFDNNEITFGRRQIFKKAKTINSLESIKYYNDSKINVIENENCTLICEASYPITWHYDLSENKNLIPTNIFINLSYDYNTLVYRSILNINLVTYINNGFYYCHDKDFWNEIYNGLYHNKIYIRVLQDVNLSLDFKLTKIYIQRHSSYVRIPCIPKTLNNNCVIRDLNQKKTKIDPVYIPFSFEYVVNSDITNDLYFECLCRTKRENVSGYQYMENIIDVKVYESFPEKALPYINLKYNKNVTVGEELKVNCTILRYCKQCKPNGKLNVNWSYNVKSTNIAHRKNIHQKYILLYNAELYLSTLVIKNAQKSDSYEYKCSAGNLISNIHVVVVDKIMLINYTWVSIIVVIFVLITVVALSTLLIKQVKLQNKIRKAGLTNFNNGVKGILNPKLYINLQADMLPYDTKLEIPRSQIKIGNQLGSGNFGLVFKGEIYGQFAGETIKTVAIKMVKRHVKYEYMKTLIVELKILSILGKHLNIIDLLGACTKNIDKLELLVIIEYCHFGNIRDILRNNRDNFLNLINHKTDEVVLPVSYVNIDYNEIVKDNCNYNQQLTTNTLINWAYQISSGMEFMATRKVLHGDLAARNILLNTNHIVKICDFGLSKNLSMHYNYKKKTQCPLPIKWMAIESIRNNTFSTQSDVWSFGVVLWEIFSLAQTPYHNIPENVDLLLIINNGYRMEQPEYSTKEIYKMMLKCWKYKPDRRPSFTLLNTFFESILEHNFRNHYLEITNEFISELKYNR